MNARNELAREAERILLDAGCVTARAQHYGPWWTVNGMRADEREVSGHTRDQADPQDPRDLARRLAAQLGPKLEIEEIPEAPETVEDAFPLGEGPFDPVLAEPPEPVETPQDDSDRETVALSEPQSAGADRSDDVEEVDEIHGETGEEAESADAGARVEDAGDDASRGQALNSDDRVVGSEGAAWEPDAEQPADEPIDADYTLPEIELIEPDPNPDFGSELLEFEGELAGEPEPVAPEAAGAFIFGDNLHQMRTAAIGLVSTHAAILTAEIEAASGEQEGEYADLQSFVVTNLDKHTGAFTLQDAPSLTRYHRWSELDATRAAVRTIDRVRKERTAFLLSAERPEIEAFDPAAGWP